MCAIVNDIVKYTGKTLIYIRYIKLQFDPHPVHNHRPSCSKVASAVRPLPTALGVAREVKLV